MNDIDTFLSQWVKAEGTGEPAALEPLLTDDFLGVGPLGFMLPKPAWLSRRDQGLTYQTFDVDEVQTRVHGDTALVTLRQQVRGDYKGNAVPEAARATLALVKAAGRWQLAGMHVSFIAGTPGAPPMPGVTTDKTEP